MKHILICIVCAALIFTMVGRWTAAESPASDAEASGEISAVSEEAVVGMMSIGDQSMQELRFSNALGASLAELGGYRFSLCHAGTGEEQSMFRKLVEDGCRAIFIELENPEDASEYITLRTSPDIVLIFLGAEPDRQLLLSQEGLYYIGFSEYNAMKEVADYINDLWESQRDLINYFDNEKFNVAFLVDQEFSESGQEEEFMGYLAKHEDMDENLVKESIITAYDFNLHLEIDRIWVNYAEILICNSSEQMSGAVSYLYDPTEFDWNRIQLILLEMDDSARRMIENGEILMAIGHDGQEQGKTAAKLVELILNEKVINRESVGASIRNERFLYLEPTVLFSEIPVKERPAAS